MITYGHAAGRSESPGDFDRFKLIGALGGSRRRFLHRNRIAPVLTSEDLHEGVSHLGGVGKRQRQIADQEAAFHEPLLTDTCGNHLRQRPRPVVGGDDLAKLIRDADYVGVGLHELSSMTAAGAKRYNKITTDRL